MSGNQINIVFLGTGSAIPPNNRQQVSFSLRHSFGLIIFDCGEGTQYSLRKFKISTSKELVICLTHLHSDHFLGLPGLLSSLQLLNRENEVVIIGPKYTKITVNNLIKANYMKIEYPLKILELEAGDKYQGRGYQLISFKSIHEDNALGFVWKENNFKGKVNMEQAKKLGIPQGPLLGRLQRGEVIEIEGQRIQPNQIVGPERRGRVVVYSGDTSYNENIVKFVPKHVDVLIHEATYPSDMKELARERGHSTIMDAANIAKKMNPTDLILTHISPRYDDLDRALIDAQRIFNNSTIAYEGMELKIPFPY